jgi:TP53 regulating kinase and related kinases
MEQGELLSQCAESKVYAANFYGHAAVVKHRFAKDYRHNVLDQKLREQRTVREARALVRCRKLGVPAPVVYSVDKLTCTIVMERIPGLSARDLIAGCADQATREAVGRRVLEAMGEIVGLLHRGDIIHGDLTTSNFIVTNEASLGSSSPHTAAATSPTTPRTPLDSVDATATGSSSSDFAHLPTGASRGLVVIDFGLVSDKNSAEERAVDLYVLERAVMSAHPLLEDVCAGHIWSGYSHTMEAAKGKLTLDRLVAVRARGRKRSMIG